MTKEVREDYMTDQRLVPMTNEEKESRMAKEKMKERNIIKGKYPNTRSEEEERVSCFVRWSK